MSQNTITINITLIHAETDNDPIKPLPSSPRKNSQKKRIIPYHWLKIVSLVKQQQEMELILLEISYIPHFSEINVSFTVTIFSSLTSIILRFTLNFFS